MATAKLAIQFQLTGFRLEAAPDEVDDQSFMLFESSSDGKDGCALCDKCDHLSLSQEDWDAHTKTRQHLENYGQLVVRQETWQFTAQVAIAVK
jgi:hypothetical protein